MPLVRVKPKTTRLFLISTIGLLCVWLVWQNIVPTGRLVIHHDLGNPSSAVTNFRPGERMDPWQTDGTRTYHTLKEGPIFFHIHTPRPFQTATFDIVYRTQTPHTPQFGDQTGPELYEFIYQPLHIIADGQWHTARVKLDLGRMYYHTTTRRYQFSFENVKDLDIVGFDVVFYKPPLTPQRVWEKITSS